MGIQERKEREKQQRYNEIVDAAERVFFKNGVEKATMDEVAEEAELSKGTLYIYFKSKEDLHFAICKRGLAILQEEFIKNISEKNSVLENLIIIGITFVRFAQKHTDYFKAMSYFENKDYDTTDEMHEHTEKDDVMNFLVSLIIKGREDGTIRKDIAPEVLGHLLWAQITGVLQLMSVKQFHIKMEHISENDIVKSHFEIIANGIRTENNNIDLDKYFK